MLYVNHMDFSRHGSFNVGKTETFYLFMLLSFYAIESPLITLLIICQKLKINCKDNNFCSECHFIRQLLCFLYPDAILTECKMT